MLLKILSSRPAEGVVLTTPRPASPISPTTAALHAEEKLAFALADGRVGVLSVCGRRVQDVMPHPPAHLAIEEREFVATGLACWAHYVFLGDQEGTLVKWDILTGGCQSCVLGRGRAVLSLAVGPAPSARIFPGGESGVFLLGFPRVRAGVALW